MKNKCVFLILILLNFAYIVSLSESARLHYEEQMTVGFIGDDYYCLSPVYTSNYYTDVEDFLEKIKSNQAIKMLIVKQSENYYVYDVDNKWRIPGFNGNQLIDENDILHLGKKSYYPINQLESIENVIIYSDIDISKMGMHNIYSSTETSGKVKKIYVKMLYLLTIILIDVYLLRISVKEKYVRKLIGVSGKDNFFAVIKETFIFPLSFFIAVVLYSILRYRFFLIQTIRYLQFIAYKEGLILLIYSSVLFVCINIIQYSFPTKELKEKSRYDE